jgi:purine-binding chemotaxis protein CheW
MNHEGVRPSGLYVLSRIGASICALPAEHVLETMRSLPMEPLVGISGFVAGIAMLRGAPTPVIDGARLLDGNRMSEGRRLLAIKIGGRRALLAVDAVLGVRRLSAESIQELPPLLEGPGLHAVNGIGRVDGDLLLVLAAARLVPDAVWTSLEEKNVA